MLSLLFTMSLFYVLKNVLIHSKSGIHLLHGIQKMKRNKTSYFSSHVLTLIGTLTLLQTMTFGQSNFKSFNNFHEYTTTNTRLYFLSQTWDISLLNTAESTIPLEALKIKRKPIVFPNPFEIDDNPTIQLAITYGYTSQLPIFEVRVYDPRGFELLRKQFKPNNPNYTFSEHIADETYINLTFSEYDLTNILSAGGYLYILFMNNEVVGKGKFAVKALNKNNNN